MVCSECGTENSDGSVFCNKCGANLSGVKVEKNTLLSKFQKFSSKTNKVGRKTKIIVICSALAIIFVFVGILYFNNPVTVFKNDIKDNKYTEAVKIYDDKIKGKTEKESSVDSFLKDDIAKIQKSYSDGKINYDTAKTRLETIDNTHLASGDVSSALNKINALNNSRIAFSKAEEFLKNNDLVNALKEYKNVIKDDTNYTKAQEQITNNEKQYKEQVLKSADEFANSKDYDKSLGVLSEALSILPNDQDVIAKDAVYKKAQEDKLATERNQKMEELKSKQELEVINTKVVPDYFSINDQAQVILKNNTQKVVKNFTIGILMYDSNGYPLKSGTLAGDNQLFKGKAEAVNIQPGQSFGNNNAWNLYSDYGTVSKLKACVMSVDYYDGSKWTNDYYSYWQEDNLGKQY